MTTKQKISQTALQLYNSKGLNNITSRHIAAEMNISPGNLHYHFKRTEDIIIHLYQELSANFDKLVLDLELDKAADIERLKLFTLKSFELINKYKFIFIHFVEIARRIPSIQLNYSDLSLRRERELMNIFEQFKMKRIFKQDIPDLILKTLIKQLFIVGDFWLSHNELTDKLDESTAKNYYNVVFLNMFYPYLSKKMQKEYLVEVSEQNHSILVSNV